MEIVKLTSYSPLVSKCEIKVCWVGQEANDNRSVITKEVGMQLANSLPGSPIVGLYNPEKQDFETHSKILTVENGVIKMAPATKPYGFVDLNPKVWFDKIVESDGVEREYLITEGWLWTGQFPEAKRIIEKGNGQSMELDEDSLDAYWAKTVNNDHQFFIINEAIISKLCILGEDVTPAFKEASITAPKTEFSLEEGFKEQVYALIKEIQDNLNEGGNNMEEEKKEELCPECGKPISECTCKPEENACNKEKEYEEKLAQAAQDQADLQTKYDELVAQFNELAAKAEETASQFKAYKAAVEKTQKQEMINSFSMLSEADKANVQEHIDEYSLKDIEAELAILCVRNKVSFETEKNTDPIVYNLQQETEVSNAPSWYKSLKEIKNN